METSKQDDTSAKQSDVSSVSGSIEKLYLYNFMFFKKLEISFSPGMNLVVAKSKNRNVAIMTAIRFVLGGITDLSYIRKGENSARVEVLLRNTGSYPYQLETFGESIHISRVVFQNGFNEYRILNSDRSTQSNSDEELLLKKIIKHFSIGIKQPLSIMCDDFIVGSLSQWDPINLYTLFMWVTELNEWNVKYEPIDKLLGLLKKDISAMSDVLEKLRKDIVYFERIYKSYSHITSLESDLSDKYKELSDSFKNVDSSRSVPVAETCVIRPSGGAVDEYMLAIGQVTYVLNNLQEGEEVVRDSKSTEVQSRIIRTEINELRAQIADWKRSLTISQEACSQKLKSTIEEYVEFKARLDLTRNSQTKLIASREMLVRQFKELRDMMGIRICFYFKSFLLVGNLTGEIKFDMESETVEVTCDKHSVSMHMRYIRKYVVLCLILCLWEVTESPFNCLDCNRLTGSNLLTSNIDQLVRVATTMCYHRQLMLFTSLSVTQDNSFSSSVNLIHICD